MIEWKKVNCVWKWNEKVGPHHRLTSQHAGNSQTYISCTRGWWRIFCCPYTCALKFVLQFLLKKIWNVRLQNVNGIYVSLYQPCLFLSSDLFWLLFFFLLAFCVCRFNLGIIVNNPVADPGFYRRGCQLPSLGSKPIIWQDFCQNLAWKWKMKNKMDR